MTHAREQYRIVSGRSANSEREEALFTSMKNNTNQTSNHHPNNIISKISLILFKLIEDYPDEYQRHLEEIRDYLLDQIKWCKETDHGVMFYDIEKNKKIEGSTLKMHHFRSYSIKEEWERKKNCEKNVFQVRI